MITELISIYESARPGQAARSARAVEAAAIAS